MMKRRYVFLVLAFVLIMGMFTIPTAHGAYTLVWSDEFDGSAVNTSNWVFDTGGGGWGNNELQYYQAANAAVSGGILTITAKRESVGGMSYTSARLKTLGKRSWTYGRIEARLAVPMGQGIWPAFWMLGTNFNGSNWPGCGEIDIMEHINSENTVYGTIHWDYNGYATYGGSTTVSSPTSYHTYTIEWTSSYIKWFVDGVQYHEANIANSINGTEEFHKPFFILLNLAVGGNWPGAPNSSTVFPAQYKVDYVRVYQDGGSATATPTPAGATPTPTRAASTPTPTPSSGSNTWYLYNTAVSGVTPSGQILQTTKSGTTGWQPTVTLNTTAKYWYSTAQTKTIPAGTWSFVLWSNNPGSSSQIKVDIHKVNSSGGGATLIASQTRECGTSGSGNHATTFTFSGIAAQSLSNQRLRVTITRTSGRDLTMAYNTNDFPTRLITP